MKLIRKNHFFLKESDKGKESVAWHWYGPFFSLHHCSLNPNLKLIQTDQSLNLLGYIYIYIFANGLTEFIYSIWRKERQFNWKKSNIKISSPSFSFLFFFFSWEQNHIWSYVTYIQNQVAGVMVWKIRMIIRIIMITIIIITSLIVVTKGVKTGNKHNPPPSSLKLWKKPP